MATYDVTTDEGKVRLLISDTGGQDGRTFLFADEEIAAFLGMRGSVRSAAALACRAIAGNEALIAKRIQFLDLTTDGPAVARAMLELADRFDRETDDDAEIEIATMDVDAFTHRQLRGL